MKRTIDMWSELGISVLLRIMAFGCTFVWLYYANRQLNIETVGDYFYQMAIVGYLIMVACMGLPMASKQLVPSLLTQRHFAETKAVYLIMLKRIMFVSVGLVCISWIVVFLFFPDLKGLLILSMAIPFQSSALLNLNMIRFLGKEKLSEYFRILHVPLFTFIITMLLLFALTSAHVLQIAFVGTVFFGFSLSVILVFKLLPAETQEEELDYQKINSNFQRLHKSFFTVNLFKALSEHLPVLLLGTFTTNTWVGIFSIVKKTMQISVFIVNSLSVYIAPIISKLYFSNQIDTLRKRTYDVSLMAFMVNLPVLVGFSIFSSEILGFFDIQDAIGISLLRILAIGQFVVLIFGYNVQLLGMTGYETVLAKTSFVFLIIRILVLFPIIQFFGLLEFGLSIVVLEFMYQVALLFYCIRKLGINNLLFIGKLVKNRSKAS